MLMREERTQNRAVAAQRRGEQPFVATMDRFAKSQFATRFIAMCLNRTHDVFLQRLGLGDLGQCQQIVGFAKQAHMRHVTPVAPQVIGLEPPMRREGGQGDGTNGTTHTLGIERRHDVAAQQGSQVLVQGLFDLLRNGVAGLPQPVKRQGGVGA